MKQFSDPLSIKLYLGGTLDGLIIEKEAANLSLSYILNMY